MRESYSSVLMKFQLPSPQLDCRTLVTQRLTIIVVTFGKSTARSSRFVSDIAKVPVPLVKGDVAERMANPDQSGVGRVADDGVGGVLGVGDAYIDFRWKACAGKGGGDRFYQNAARITE